MNNGNTYYCGKEEVQNFFSQPRIFLHVKIKMTFIQVKFLILIKIVLISMLAMIIFI